MALAGHVFRAMMERYSHIRMEEKRRAVEDLSGKDFEPAVAQNWAKCAHPSYLISRVQSILEGEKSDDATSLTGEDSNLRPLIESSIQTKNQQITIICDRWLPLLISSGLSASSASHYP